ncbi:Rrf2 family transcriptional regulator [Pigmentiphaga sp. GD03639]|uniref:RrF2 family transcriptional regulator n=1 Tax=Pigmentiphaga sp. GD03639 TaxID=2975354 RepID=UPI00244978D5|nr:Rrf2 family transcriptional regulator [Pigmentiphaga sp. GD03639]MDH2235462.1 Rrf2 family transcriptional regulator [Pigmentiphaga sp. GD03639]
MRLTVQSDYALRLLMHVGAHADRLCTIAEIAQVHGISAAHLMKVTHRLGQLGYLETVRGKGGGMRLARPPERIGLAQVLRDLEPDFHLVECHATGSACVLTGHCRLTGILDAALQRFLQHLDHYTLADLLPADGPPLFSSFPIKAAS